MLDVIIGTGQLARPLPPEEKKKLQAEGRLEQVPGHSNIYRIAAMAKQADEPEQGEDPKVYETRDMTSATDARPQRPPMRRGQGRRGR